MDTIIDSNKIWLFYEQNIPKLYHLGVILNYQYFLISTKYSYLEKGAMQ